MDLNFPNTLDEACPKKIVFAKITNKIFIFVDLMSKRKRQIEYIS
jgi:hypothetical protein